MNHTASGAADHPYVAGVDTSTQSCKLVVVDPHTGHVVRQSRAPHPGGTEVDPEAWWAAFLATVDGVGGLDDVAALSVGGQQHGMVCLDEAGAVIRPALLWNDTRSAVAAEDLIQERSGEGAEHAGGASWWAQTTGSVPVASLTVTKLRWLADHEPDNARRIRAICLPHDWLTWKISGSTQLNHLTTDRSDASGTGYLGLELGPAGQPVYRRDILAQALRCSQQEAEAILLPHIATPWASTARGDPNRGWGHIQLGAGCGDNAASVLGVNLGAGQALLSLGTSGVVAAVSDQPVIDPEGLVTGFADATGRWLPLACTLNASRIIDAMAALTGTSYEQLNELALSVPDSAGLTLTPYFDGERTPNLPDATASLSGMTLANTDRAHAARAAVEGLLDLMRGALDAVRRLGVEVNDVCMVGGGAQSKAVQALAADRLDAHVIIPAAAEYVALGAARQAARTLGHPAQWTVS